MSVCNQNVFKKIYFQWNEPLQRFLQSKGLERGKTADLVQESFIRLWKNCAKVLPEKSKSFLFTAANNLFIDAYRQSQCRIKLQSRLPKIITVEDGQYQFEMKEFQAHLEAAINSMTPASKEVFLLHRFNEMSYQEIATRLELSIKAVEKRMTKALKHLAIQIQEWGNK
ncbi:MAG: RNA polymerase sigma factor [Saprospiraceae bacterium]